MHIKDACQSCEAFQRAAKQAKLQAPQMSLPIIEQPFAQLRADVIGPLRRMRYRKKCILTILDFGIRYPEALPMPKVMGEYTVEGFLEFTRFGMPMQLLFYLLFIIYIYFNLLLLLFYVYIVHIFLLISVLYIYIFISKKSTYLLLSSGE